MKVENVALPAFDIEEEKFVEEIYEKYRQKVLLNESDIRNSNVVKDLEYYKKKRSEHRGRRVEESIMKLMKLAGGEKFFDIPPDQLSVIDLCCGIPFTREMLNKKYGIKKFVGVDIMKKELFEKFIPKTFVFGKKDNGQEFVTCNNIYEWEFYSNDVHFFVPSHKQKYDIIVSCINMGSTELAFVESLAKEKCLIVFDYKNFKIKK